MSDPKSFCLLLIVAVSFVTLYVTGEASVKLERAEVDCAAPIYLFNVLAGIGSVACGVFGLLECYKLTKKRGE